MQRRPGSRDKSLYPVRSGRTQPALPGATLPTAPVAARPQYYPEKIQTSAKKRPNYGRRALLTLLGLGALLEMLLLAVYPLLAAATFRTDAAMQALLHLFPWLPRLYWTSVFPFFVTALSHIPLFALARDGTGAGGGNANLLLFLLQPAAFRERFGLPQRFILFVGRLVPEKGVFDLLHAYAKLGSDLRSEVGLVFAGDGASKEALSEQAKLIEPGMVYLAGFAQREDLAGLYALAEAFILPTHSDPWGLVVNEAMACGLPIVVTDVAGCASDLVEDGWNGYVVPPANPDRLSAAISSMLRQPETTQQMRVRSSERIQGYSPQACANGLAEVTLAEGTENR